MATKKIMLGGVTPGALYLGSTRIRRCYLGAQMVWDEPLFVDEPKIDPAHPLYANVTTMDRLMNGDPVGMTVSTGSAAIVDGAFASAAEAQIVFAQAPFPAANSRTFRVSALIKVDKTSGRYSRIGFASNSATPTTASPDVYVGHVAGQGIILGSVNFAVPLGHTILAEAACVDGAWYRVTLAYDNITDKNTTDTNTGKARVMGAVEAVDPVNTPANPWYPVQTSGRHDSQGASPYVPMALVVRTNSTRGTIKNLHYIDSMLGASSDNAPINMEAKMGAGTDTNDRLYLWSKGKAAPLRVIVTAGGSGVYGGIGGWGAANGRAGHPYDAFRKFWRDLGDLGYTVLHSEALHEGWGADDHLAKQLEALNAIKAEFGTDVRLYYLGYSMGGLSAWRAIMGRAGFPAIRAAYLVAGAAHLDMYYDNPNYTQIKTRWPDRGALDEPINFDGATLVGRGTRVRMVTSTGDANMPKTQSHDPMVAKFTANGGASLISELVHDGIGHFDPAYWNAQDCVDFFEGADL